MRNYPVEENPIGSAVTEILRYKQTDKQTSFNIYQKDQFFNYSGDFNCKCHWWGYKDSDSLGRDIQSLVNNDNVSFLNNKDTATLLKVRRMLKQG